MFSFLQISPAALNAGLGETYVNTSAASAWENPAILPWVNHQDLTVSYLSYLSDISYSYMQYTRPINSNTAIAASVGYLGVADLNRTVADGSLAGYSNQGTFSSYDADVSLSYGKRLSREFSYGVTLSGVQESIDTSNTSGVMMSLGGFYRPDRVDWQAGFGVVNIGPAVKGYSLPTGIFAGVASAMYPHFFWSGEVMGYMDQAVDIRTGLEYEINHTFFLRVGYQYPLNDYGLGDFPNVNLSGGLGFKLEGLMIDYAWVPYGDLGITNRLTISWAIGSDMVKKRNLERRR
ncbi:MAG: PorV/PorQ family protein [Endomicrobiales bacterium]